LAKNGTELNALLNGNFDGSSKKKDSVISINMLSSSHKPVCCAADHVLWEQGAPNVS